MRSRLLLLVALLVGAQACSQVYTRRGLIEVSGDSAGLIESNLGGLEACIHSGGRPAAAAGLLLGPLLRWGPVPRWNPRTNVRGRVRIVLGGRGAGQSWLALQQSRGGVTYR